MNQIEYERVFARNMQAAFLRPRTRGTWHMSHSPPINSLAPGRFQWNLEYLNFKFIFAIDCWVVSCEIAIMWLSVDRTDDKSSLVQVMAWCRDCRQATSHYPSHCESRSISPHGVFKSQSVNPISFSTWLERKSLWCISHLGEIMKQLYAIHLDIGASRRFYNLLSHSVFTNHFIERIGKHCD